MERYVLQILAATVGALGFGILFQIRGRRLLPAAFGGGLGWLLYLLLCRVIPDEAVNYFIVALVVSLYAEIMARVLKSPATIFLAPSLIPLVPGASLYHTMSHAFEGNMLLFADKAIATVKLAAALAVGVILSAIIMKLYTKLVMAKQQRIQNKTAK